MAHQHKHAMQYSAIHATYTYNFVNFIYFFPSVQQKNIYIGHVDCRMPKCFYVYKQRTQLECVGKSVEFSLHYNYGKRDYNSTRTTARKTKLQSDSL